MSKIDVPHKKVFEDIKRHLGGVVPCYGESTGCCVDDDTNSSHCDEGCLLLRIYKIGYRAAVDDLRNSTP